MCAFLESLPCTVGPHAGKPLALRPWQREIIAAIYRQGPDGQRICRSALVSMARGNGKTGLSVGLALAHLMGPQAEPRGEIIFAARTRDQAAIAFRETEATIMASPDLAARVNIVKFKKEIHVEDGPGAGSRLAVIAADAKSAHGLNPSFALYDEGGMSRDRELYDAIRTALGKRAAPLMACIGTQAEDDEHWFAELCDYAAKVTAGEIDDPRFVGIVHAAPHECALDDETAWAAANPGLGDLVSLDHIRALAADAKRQPSGESSFRRFHLNQRVAMRQGLFTRELWTACTDASVTAQAMSGKLCFGGLDLSSVRDLTAFVLVFPDGDGGFAVLPHFWLPQKTIRESVEYRGVPIEAWAKAGLVEAVPGAALDHRFVARRVAEICEAYRVELIGYDRWRVEDFRRELAEIGAEIALEPVGQGFASMSPAVDALERLALNGKLSHGGHPVLNWNAANLTVERDAAGNRKPSKRRAAERIDGMAALLMALHCAARHAPEPAWEPLAVWV